jgi:hypothetical protein
MKITSLSADNIAQRMFRIIAQTFPVACASDEFYYFPHLRLPDQKWSIWDQFSNETISDIVNRLLSWENELNKMIVSEPDQDIRIDLALLRKFAGTLREQLSSYKIWQNQPTFYLTLASIGLAEAMESSDPSAIHERAIGLPAFLDQAADNLSRVPLLFRDIGIEMISDTKQYIELIRSSVPELSPAIDALKRFEKTLKEIETSKDFLLQRDMLEHIIRFHISAEMDIKEVHYVLDQEIYEMNRILEQEPGNIGFHRNLSRGRKELWQEVYESIPLPDKRNKEIIRLYSDEVSRLKQHCIDKRFVSHDLVEACPVQVTSMPSFLSAIRTASSYSISPGFASSGGTFYIFRYRQSEKAQQENLRELRMLSAHETYPGHHLLDISRFNRVRSCRAPVEQPIFYEGWACFAEELMRLTGYFTEPCDRLILAKRRFWRAIRGKVDLGLQTGTMNISTAARYLKRAGISYKKALSSVRKYPLNPGYQLCYTIGLRRFLDLFERYGRESLQHFVQNVLTQGEILFTDLEDTFRKTGK